MRKPLKIVEELIEKLSDDTWNEAILTAINQAKHFCPEAKDLHDALEACLIKED